jgi:hypothetical protein
MDLSVLAARRKLMVTSSHSRDILPIDVSTRLRTISYDILDTTEVAPNFIEKQTYLTFHLPTMHQEMT